MKKLVFLGLILISAAADAQTRVRGTIEAYDGKSMVVKGAGSIQLGEKTEIVFTQPIALGDIKPGDFLGVTSVRRADGSLTAY